MESPCSNLPLELLLHIFCFLDDTSDFMRCGQCCRTWNELLSIDVNWKTFAQFRWIAPLQLSKSGEIKLLPRKGKNEGINVRERILPLNTNQMWRKEFLRLLKIETAWKSVDLLHLYFQSNVVSPVSFVRYENSTMLFGSASCGSVKGFNVRQVTWLQSTQSNQLVPKLFFQLRGHLSCMIAGGQHDTKIVCGYSDGRVGNFELNGLRSQFSARSNTQNPQNQQVFGITCLKVVDNDTIIVSGSADGYITLWKIYSARIRECVTLEGVDLSSLQEAEEDVCTYANAADLEHLKNRFTTKNLAGVGCVDCCIVDLTNNSRLFIVVAGDISGNICLWELHENNGEFENKAKRRLLYCKAKSSVESSINERSVCFVYVDRKKVVGAYTDGTIAVWDLLLRSELACCVLSRQLAGVVPSEVGEHLYTSKPAKNETNQSPSKRKKKKAYKRNRKINERRALLGTDGNQEQDSIFSHSESDFNIEDTQETVGKPILVAREHIIVCSYGGNVIDFWQCTHRTYSDNFHQSTISNCVNNVECRAYHSLKLYSTITSIHSSQNLLAIATKHGDVVVANLLSGNVLRVLPSTGEVCCVSISDDCSTIAAAHLPSVTGQTHQLGVIHLATLDHANTNAQYNTKKKPGNKVKAFTSAKKQDDRKELQEYLDEENEQRQRSPVYPSRTRRLMEAEMQLLEGNHACTEEERLMYSVALSFEALERENKEFLISGLSEAEQLEYALMLSQQTSSDETATQ